MKIWRQEAGFTVVEVLVAAFILVIGVVGVSGAFSVAFTDVVASSGESKATAYARQQLEVLKNQPYANVRAQIGAWVNDTPEADFQRSWRADLVAGTLPPNEVLTITVTVIWRQGWGRSKTINMQTNRMQWG
jgi:Tfp pilus assembly protein PilV